MTRHGFVDYCDFDEDPNLLEGRWLARVKSAMRGKRGQAFLRDLIAALDAMPVKELHPHNVAGENLCAMGVVGVYRGADLTKPQEELNEEDGDHEWATEYTGDILDIAPSLAREVAYLNDEGFYGTPAETWSQMRRWAEKNLIKENP